MPKLARWIRPSELPRASLIGVDEIAVCIKALQRSSQAMPDDCETFKSREVRAMRETRLADRLRRALC